MSCEQSSGSVANAAAAHVTAVAHGGAAGAGRVAKSGTKAKAAAALVAGMLNNCYHQCPGSGSARTRNQ